jgi:hypothetical protein
MTLNHNTRTAKAGECMSDVSYGDRKWMEPARCRALWRAVVLTMFNLQVTVLGGRYLGRQVCSLQLTQVCEN